MTDGGEIVKRCESNLVLIVSGGSASPRRRAHQPRAFWEATAEDITSELKGNPALASLLKARHLIVTFSSSDAAFWLDNDPAAKKASMLVFDAEHAEGEWSESQGKERCSDSCPVSSAPSFMNFAALRPTNSRTSRPPSSRDWAPAGNCAALGTEGSIKIKVKQPDGQVKEEEVDNPNPGFPVDEIAAKSASLRPGLSAFPYLNP